MQAKIYVSGHSNMALTTNTFSYFYNKIATICQDQSTNGIAQASDAVNTVIKEITREFRLPEMFKGQDQSAYVRPTIGLGTQLLSLAADVSRLSTVYWVDNAETIYQLTEIPGDSDWNEMTDFQSTGDPVVFRYFQPSNINQSSVAQIEIWSAPNQGWLSKSNGNLYYTYWAQLAQLVNPTDIPNLPYELDTILTNGGILEMARQQGDDKLISLYSAKYEDDKGEMRAWIVKQRTQDGQMQPEQPEGVFGRGAGYRGYKMLS